jgi:hypothetical protein
MTPLPYGSSDNAVATDNGVLLLLISGASLPYFATFGEICMDKG